MHHDYNALEVCVGGMHVEVLRFYPHFLSVC